MRAPTVFARLFAKDVCGDVECHIIWVYSAGSEAGPKSSYICSRGTSLIYRFSLLELSEPDSLVFVCWSSKCRILDDGREAFDNPAAEDVAHDSACVQL